MSEPYFGTQQDQSYAILLNEGQDRLVYRRGSGDTVEILDIEVTSGRRKGLGRKLIDTLVNVRLPKRIKLVWAVTRIDNMIAQHFYENLGFRVVAVLREFYRDDERLRGCVDAVMYGLDVNNGDQS